MKRLRMVSTQVVMMVAVVVFAIGPSSAAPAASCTEQWEIVPSPSPGTNIQSLNSVASLSASEAWAVGLFGYTDHHGQFAVSPLIEHWDGAAWAVSGGHMGSGALAAVAALAPDDVWAVGHSGLEPLDMRPIVVHYDGTGWRVVSSPQIAEGTLGTIVAISADDIWAAGMEIGTFHTIIEHWDGTIWTAVPHPSPRSAYVNLASLSAVSSSDVWLVGNYLDRHDVSRPLALHWDGTSWQVVETPNVGTRGTSLSGVAAVAWNDVWASGTVTVSDSRSRALLEHWDGVRWAAIPPERAGKTSAFDGIAAPSVNDIWAVGSWSNSPDGGTRTLVEHSSGVAFTRVTSPNANDLDNRLLSVSESPDGYVWAVGFYQEPEINKTLTMRSCT